MTLASQLAALESGGLILLTQWEPEVEYLFRHALVQEAAYHSLVKVDRRMLHRAVGEALERLNPDGLASPELAPLLAHHFAEAGDYPAALRYYTLAARAAAQVYANTEAIGHFDRALEIAQTLAADSQTITDIFLQRGHALELNAQDVEAIKNYESMEAWALSVDSRPAQLAALTARATIYVKPSVEQDLARGYDLSQQALMLARELGDRAAEAKVMWNLLQYHMVATDMDQAVAAGETALAIAREQGLSEQVAYVLTDLLKVYFQSDRPERATAALEEARAIWRDRGILNMLADNLNTTAMMHVVAGEYEQALQISEEGRRVSHAIGNLWNQAYSYYMVDLAHFDRGDIDQAIEWAQMCGRLSEQAGFSEGITHASISLAMIYSYMGAPAHAREAISVERARAEARYGIAYSGPLVEAIGVYLLFKDGRIAEARTALDQARPDVEELRRSFFLTYYFFAMVEAELALAAGNFQRALELAGDVLPFLRQANIHLFLADMLCLQGRGLVAASRPEQAALALAAARTEAENIGSRRMLWLILAELASLEASRGNHEAARALYGQAAEIIDYIVEHAGSAELAQSFLNRPEVRAVLRQAGREA